MQVKGKLLNANQRHFQVSLCHIPVNLPSSFILMQGDI